MVPVVDGAWYDLAGHYTALLRQFCQMVVPAEAQLMGDRDDREYGDTAMIYVLGLIDIF